VGIRIRPPCPLPQTSPLRTAAILILHLVQQTWPLSFVVWAKDHVLPVADRSPLCRAHSPETEPFLE
jgi:hypothetical protein